jgi:hypothetical protein
MLKKILGFFWLKRILIFLLVLKHFTIFLLNFVNFLAITKTKEKLNYTVNHFG